MTVTPLLYLNLRNTLLDDFAEHIRVSLEHGTLLVPQTEDTLMGILGNDKDKPYDWYFEQSGKGPVVVAHEPKVSVVRRAFSVYYISNFRVQETLSVDITRYRTDFLTVTMFLYLDHADPTRDTTNFAKNAFLDWLRPRWGDAITELPLEDAPLEKEPPIVRQPVYSENNQRTTIVHYLVTERGMTQKMACDFLQVAPGTYRRHRNEGLLLSNEDYQKKYGESIRKAASPYI